MTQVRILFLADTHLGIDQPLRPRVKRRRRGPDFFANFERALKQAIKGEADAVVHGGDLLYRSRVPAGLVDMAFAPLKAVADAGVPVFLVPGNHERSHIPHALLSIHPRIHVFDKPRTFVESIRGSKLALGGFPYCRQGVRARFRALVRETDLVNSQSDLRILCMHQCFEGSKVGPSGYTFRDAADVVRASDLPSSISAVLSGHIHRFQVLSRDLNNAALRAPVLYPGSIERTSFAEKDERKGYLLITLAADNAPIGRLQKWTFRELPARPMRQIEIDATRTNRSRLEQDINAAIQSAPQDAILQLRVRGRLTENQMGMLGAEQLRKMAPETMNVSVHLPRNSDQQA